MVTIDDFAVKDATQYTGYSDTLSLLATEFDAQSNKDLPFNHLMKGDDAPRFPISTFELPYKMQLSPIALPADKQTPENPFPRRLGEYLFEKPNDVFYYLNSNLPGKPQIDIVAPWENNLIYRDKVTFQVSPPRFKVVKVECQDTDVDDSVDLLPAPVHRYELRGLTMREDWDRDVVADYFRISSIGGSTILKYNNDDPLKYSTIAWEQRVKYARDNYVSVTFRAID